MRLPNVPPGDIRRLYLHWTGGDYATVYPAYHFCIALRDGEPLVVATHDVRANMRDVARDGGAYAAHTAGRNAYAIGIAICGMRDAVPADFGAFPLVEAAIDAACALAAHVCAAYALPIDASTVATHAEAACADGYFGCGDGERWDIARLAAAPAPLVPADARNAGEHLRARARALGGRADGARDA